MSTETFYTLISRNKRNSWILIIVFTLFFIGLGLLIGAVWGGGQAAFSITVAVVAAVIAFIITLASYYGGPSLLLSMSRAREITHDDDPQLFNVVEELSIAGGMPMPRVFIIDEPAMNAFATGRNPQNAAVAITSGLRTRLKRDELQGVMAHELSHVRNYDILFSMLVAVMVGVIVMMCDVFLRSMWWGGGRRSRSREREGGGGGIQIIFMVVALVLAIIAPILAKVIEMALSRQREYMADAGSVELTRNPQGLIGALEKLAGDQEVLQVANRATAGLYFVHPIKRFEGGQSSMFDSHPAIQDRIARIQSLTV
ncbi:MAG: zinc metalloprotease HtpX [Phycisphaerae bacterium]